MQDWPGVIQLNGLALSPEGGCPTEDEISEQANSTNCGLLYIHSISIARQLLFHGLLRLTGGFSNYSIGSTSGPVQLKASAWNALGSI